MALETPSNAIGRIDVNQLVRPAEAVVEPRATAMLTDAFRQGVVTADDIVSRLGELGKSKDKAQIAQNELGAAQAERQLILQQYPAVAYFDKLAPAAGITEPKLPDGTPDYKQMEIIGAKLAVHQAQRSESQAKLDNISKEVHGGTMLSTSKQGDQVYSPEYVENLRKRATASFQDFDQQAPGTVQTAPPVGMNGMPLVTPKATPSAVPPVVEPVQGTPAGTRVGMGTSLGPAATTPKAPTDAQQRAELALARFAQSGDMQTSLNQAGYDPTSIGSWMNSMLPQILKNGDRKQYESAVDLWSQGLLRLESGAAISHQEKNWYERSFFPQVGDPQSVVSAKEAARHDVERMVAEIAQQGGVVSPESKAQAQRIYARANEFSSGAVAAPSAGAAVKVTSPEEARSLPQGTVFITPDGQQRVRR